jgi:hypothetical protein
MHPASMGRVLRRLDLSRQKGAADTPDEEPGRGSGL